MYYLISVNTRNGEFYHPCGNSGSMRGRYKAPRYILRQAHAFAKSASAEHVYKLPVALYTQKVCELSNSAFCKYIMLHGVKMV